MKKLNQKKEQRQKEDPLVFFLSCLLELREKPLIKDYIKKNPHCMQLIMVPMGKGARRKLGPIRSMLKFDPKRKSIFEQGLIRYLHFLDHELGHMPSSDEISVDCKKYGIIDLVQMLYKCNLFDGHIDDLYAAAGFKIKK
jgi:hypothetical protein